MYLAECLANNRPLQVTARAPALAIVAVLLWESLALLPNNDKVSSKLLQSIEAPRKWAQIWRVDEISANLAVAVHLIVTVTCFLIVTIVVLSFWKRLRVLRRAVWAISKFWSTFFMYIFLYPLFEVLLSEQIFRSISTVQWIIGIFAGICVILYNFLIVWSSFSPDYRNRHKFERAWQRVLYLTDFVAILFVWLNTRGFSHALRYVNIATSNLFWIGYIYISRPTMKNSVNLYINCAFLFVFTYSICLILHEYLEWNPDLLVVLIYPLGLRFLSVGSDKAKDILDETNYERQARGSLQSEKVDFFARNIAKQMQSLALESFPSGRRMILIYYFLFQHRSQCKEADCACKSADFSNVKETSALTYEVLGSWYKVAANSKNALNDEHLITRWLSFQRDLTSRDYRLYIDIKAFGKKFNAQISYRLKMILELFLKLICEKYERRVEGTDAADASSFNHVVEFDVKLDDFRQRTLDILTRKRDMVRYLLSPTLEVTQLTHWSLMYAEVRDLNNKFRSFLERSYSSSLSWNIFLLFTKEVTGDLSLLSSIRRKRIESVHKMEKVKLGGLHHRLSTVVALAVDENLGMIQHYSHNFPKTFGFSAKELENRRINVLIPPYFLREHDAWMKGHLEKAHISLNGETPPRLIFAMHKHGHLVPLHISVQVEATANSSLHMAAMLSPVLSPRNFLTVDGNGSIIGVSRDLKAFLSDKVSVRGGTLDVTGMQLFIFLPDLEEDFIRFSVELERTSQKKEVMHPIVRFKERELKLFLPSELEYLQIVARTAMKAKGSFTKGRTRLSDLVESYDERSFVQMDLLASLSAIYYPRLGAWVYVLEVSGFRHDLKKTTSFSDRPQSHHLSNLSPTQIDANLFGPGLAALQTRNEGDTETHRQSRIPPIPKVTADEDELDVLDEQNLSTQKKPAAEEFIAGSPLRQQREFQPIPVYGRDELGLLYDHELSIDSIESTHDEKGLVAVDRSVGSRESSSMTKNDQRGRIAIRSRLNRVVQEDYYPRSFKVTRYYLLSFIGVVVSLLLVLDLVNSGQYTAFSLIVRDVTKTSRVSSRFFIYSNFIVQSHLIGVNLITEKSTIARMQRKYESIAQKALKEYMQASLLLWDKAHTSDEMWNKMWISLVNITYSVQTARQTVQVYGFPDSFNQIVEQLRIFLKPVKGNYTAIQDEAWLFTRTNWLQIAPYLVPIRTYMIGVSDQKIAEMKNTWSSITWVTCCVFVFVLILVYPIYLRKELWINRNFGIFTRLDRKEMELSMDRLTMAIEKFSGTKLLESIGTNGTRRQTRNLSSGQVATKKATSKTQRASLYHSNGKRVILVVGIFLLCGISVAFFVVRYLVVVDFLVKIGMSTNYVAAIFSGQSSLTAYSTYILWFVDFTFTTMTTVKNEAAATRTRMATAVASVRSQLAILNMMLSDLDNVGPQLGMKPESIALFRHFSRQNFCEDIIELSTVDRLDCETMLGGIAQKGLMTTLADIVTRLNVSAEVVTKLTASQLSVVRPYVDGQVNGETYALLYHVSQLLLRGTEVLIADAQAYIELIQSGILISSIVFGVVLAIVFLLIWRPFENATKKAYQAPFRLLLLIPTNALLGNSYVGSFLKANVPVQTNDGPSST